MNSFYKIASLAFTIAILISLATSIPFKDVHPEFKYTLCVYAANDLRYKNGKERICEFFTKRDRQCHTLSPKFSQKLSYIRFDAVRNLGKPPNLALDQMNCLLFKDNSCHSVNKHIWQTVENLKEFDKNFKELESSWNDAVQSMSCAWGI
ncbi:hypothetical protein EJ08DRAFT_649574 [Tothia fuscella]|uniref:Uncharacterized protein n=1 Tax=Tothia fuscella TaxID=1048955 RepID=A0A9P4TXN9_9PEZI|nr:hypothetical protein EJ08DRAFT_649574 [Tothia fuscella]